MGAVEDLAGPSVAGLAFGLLIAGALVAVLTGALRRRRAAESRDRADDGVSAPSEIPHAPSPVTARPSAPSPPERSQREVRTGPRRLSTEPDDPDAQAFKQRLVDAVADLADNVEDMPGGGGPAKRLTSEEMIARAKKRIAQWDET